MSLAPGHRRPAAGDDGFFRYCPRCATPLERAEVHGLFRPRCPGCGFVQFRTPGSGVAGVAWEEDIVKLLGVAAVREGLEDSSWEPAPFERRLLLVRRRSSRHPGWCIPCGWVEYDEEIRSALAREMQEETGLEVTTGALVAVHSNFHEPGRQSVGTWFAVTPVGGCLRAGDDAVHLRFCAPGQVDVPLAFPTDALVLAELRDRPALPGFQSVPGAK